MKRRIALVVLAVAAAVLASCSNPFFGKSKSGSGSVIVKFAQAGTASTTLASRALSAATARTIVPGIDANADSYKITLTSGSYPTQTVLLLKANLSSSSPSYTFPNVEVGTWDVTVEAQKAGVVFGRGSVAGQSVNQGQASSTPVIPVFPVDAALSGGTGDISFTIGIMDSGSTWSANLELFDSTDTIPISGTQQLGLTFAPSPHEDIETTYALTGIASGTYALEVSLFKGGVLAGKYLEAVNVWNGLTSNQWLGPNGDGGWTLSSYRLFSTAELLESNSDLFSLTMLGADGTTLVIIPSSITNFDLGPVTKGQTITFSAIQAALQYGNVPSQEPPASLTYTWNGGAPRSLANNWESVAWDYYSHHVFDPCPPLPLKSGLNTLVATVTSPDGRNTKTYTVTMEWTPSYTSTTSVEMVSVAGGSFQRDATSTDISTVSNFMIGKYEITQAQWIAVVSTYPDDMNDVIPRTSVTWFDIVGFCNRLSQMEGFDSVYTILDGNGLPWDGSFPVGVTGTVTADWSKNGYRLPTEMEYMWAAMGGLKAAGYVGGLNGVNTTGYQKEFAGDLNPTVAGDPIGDYAWYAVNRSAYSVTSVGTKLPNELGLYDMSGNAWAMCWDLSERPSERNADRLHRRRFGHGQRNSGRQLRG